MKIAKNDGFTIVEIAVVIVVIGILAGLVYTFIVPHSTSRTYYIRSMAEFNTMANANSLYVAKYNDYPPDVSRDIPAGMKEFIQGQYANNAWPAAPYPGSVYDYENWPPDGNGPEQTYQISIRMCSPGDDATCKDNAKKWLSDYVPAATLDAWDSYSAMYYCIKGSCRSHQTKPISYPGFCVNCGGKSNVF